MKRLSLLLIAFLSYGCVGMSGQEALFLDSEDVQQAIDLRDSRDPKVCLRVTGTGNVQAPATGVTGGLVGIIATGKHMSFDDCVTYLSGVRP